VLTAVFRSLAASGGVHIPLVIRRNTWELIPSAFCLFIHLKPERFAPAGGLKPPQNNKFLNFPFLSYIYFQDNQYFSFKITTELIFIQTVF
jgi:hypothetical protein